jgi:hypothetical protein
MSFVKKIDIQMYAGCQIKTMIDTKNDEEFSEMWRVDSAKHGFDAKDIDRWMMEFCGPISDEEVGKGLEKYYSSVNFSDMDEEKVKRERLKREKSMNAYQRKFLRREFTALKNEPPSEFLSEIAPE